MSSRLQSSIALSLWIRRMTMRNGIWAGPLNPRRASTRRRKPTWQRSSFVHSIGKVTCDWAHSTCVRHRYDKAIENYRKALALCPDSGQLYYALGGAYSEAEDYRNAVDALQKSIQLRPYWQAYHNLGIVHLKPPYIAALDALQNAVRLTNTKDYRLFEALARVYWLTHDVTKAREAAGIAIPEAEKLLKLNARDSDVLLLLGQSYAIMGRQPEALSNLSLGLKADPNEPHNLVFAAGAYMQLGDRNTALQPDGPGSSAW